MSEHFNTNNLLLEFMGADEQSYDEQENFETLEIKRNCPELAKFLESLGLSISGYDKTWKICVGKRGAKEASLFKISTREWFEFSEKFIETKKIEPSVKIVPELVWVQFRKQI